MRRAQALTTSPTVAPTTAPTSTPTSVPSSVPSSVPTSVPTTAPTTAPSFAPTTVPTSFPSVHPSVQPSLHPSVHPSVQPSLHPSVHPSTVPSFLPSSNPTNEHHPSAAPSFLPTIEVITGRPVIANASMVTESPVIVNGITKSPVIANASITESPVIVILSVIESDSPSYSPTYIPTTEIVTIIPVSNANMTNIDDGRDGSILVISLTMLFAIIALCIGYRAISKPKKSAQETSVIVGLASQVEPLMMPQVIRSEYGGWQGTYTDEQMSNVDVESHVKSLRQFSIDDNNNPPPEVFMDVGSTPGSNYSDTANDLRMIEHADSTDEALMRAYEEAMNVDIEPEDPNVEALMTGNSPGAMSGMGSSPNTPNDNSNRGVVRLSPDHQIDLPDLPPIT